MAAFHNSVRALTRDQVRDVDRRAIEEYGQPGVVLMENAGRNAAALLHSLGISGKVSICCGKGNNAGDGFVVARHLDCWGVSAEVLLASPSNLLTGDAAINFRVLSRSGVAIVEPSSTSLAAFWQASLQTADWIVDGILGTGAKGIVTGPFAQGIDAINAAGRPVFSLDLPSGMDCDTGQPLGTCVRANHTATFVARKVGFDAPAAAQYTGQVHVLEIGVPRRLLDELQAATT